MGVEIKRKLDKMLFLKKLQFQQCFLFFKCQEAVRRERTKGSSIDFIGYQISHYEQMAAQSCSQGINQ